MSQTAEDVRRVEEFTEKYKKRLAELMEQARKRRFKELMESRPGTGRLARGLVVHGEDAIGPDPLLVDISFDDHRTLERLGVRPFYKGKGMRNELGQKIIRRAAMKQIEENRRRG